jgi:hypothetical protein
MATAELAETGEADGLAADEAEAELDDDLSVVAVEVEFLYPLGDRVG